MVSRGAPLSAVRAEIAALECRDARGELTRAERDALQRLLALETLRKSRLPRQIAACRRKLERLEAAFHG